jgi:hypothetical protein
MTLPALEDLLAVLTGDLPCIPADDVVSLKLLALEFKCDRVLTNCTASPNTNHTLSQRERVCELFTYVSDLSSGKTDESLES